MIWSPITLSAILVSIQPNPELVRELFKETPPEAYLDPADQEIARTGRGTEDRPFPCARYKKYPGIDEPVIESLPTDECVQMTEPQIWTGIWRDEFEGSQFCAAPATRCAFDSQAERVWLAQRDKSFKGGQRPYDGSLYAVEFLGRRTKYPGSYGHLGVSQHEIIVDRMLSIRKLDPDPPAQTEAE